MIRTSIVLLFAAALVNCASAPAPPAARPAVTSDADLDALLPRLSNWGRWGAADQRGTLNYITTATVRNARTLVTDGRTVSLARAITLAGNGQPDRDFLSGTLASRQTALLPKAAQDL